MGQEGPEPVDHAEEVDGHDPLEVGQGQLGDGQPAAADTGVVAHEVHVAEVLERRRGERRDIAVQADVGRHGQHLGAAAAQRLARPRQHGSLDVGQHHALGGEAPRHGQPDARRRTGDDRDPAGELLHAYTSER